MNARDRAALVGIVQGLRSENRGKIRDAESALLTLAGLSRVACSCPDFPVLLSPDCFAHLWIAEAIYHSPQYQQLLRVARTKDRLRADAWSRL